MKIKSIAKPPATANIKIDWISFHTFTNELAD